MRVMRLLGIKYCSTAILTKLDCAREEPHSRFHFPSVHESKSESESESELVYLTNVQTLLSAP